MDMGQAFVCVYVILLGIAILLVPPMRYVLVGWAAKRKDIMDGLGLKSRIAYFQMFSKSSEYAKEVEGPVDIFNEFEALYEKWYGRRLFFTPVAVVALTTAIAVTAVVFTVLHRWAYLPCNPLFDVPRTAMAAFAGAYMWVVNDFIWRARRLDFSPADVHWGTLRLAISVPMGYAFAGVVKDSHLIEFVAFALGAFPLEGLLAIMRRLLMKTFVLKPTRDESRDDIVKLQGVNRDVVERLAKEDITTVAQIAYCDPVRVIMRSNLTFNFVMDIMNQALLWMYVQEWLEQIRPLGMRGAVEVEHIINDVDRKAGTSAAEKAAKAKLEAAQKAEADAQAEDAAAVDATVKAAAGTKLKAAVDARAAAEDEVKKVGEDAAAAKNEANAALAEIAKKLAQPVETVKVMFREIAGDPYTLFLTEVWADVIKIPGR